METTNFKTEKQKRDQEVLRKIILNHCLVCHQQLDTLRLRLISFDDLVEGVKTTFITTTRLLKEHETRVNQKETSIDKPTLKKV